MNRQSAKRRAAQPAYDEAIETLRLVVGDRCELCGRRGSTEPDHCVGRTGERLSDTRFIILIDRECHDMLHRMSKQDAASLRLACLRFAARGSVAEYWRVTGREWPDEAMVERWVDRLLLNRRSDFGTY